MVGKRLAHYEILNKLGQGGMASVYLGRDTRLDRLVALKVLPADTADERSHIRFLREAQAISALNHQNIVTIYEIATDAGITYIAMEYLQGPSLNSLIQRSPIPLELAVTIAVQIVEGLAKAHAAGIVHRDLKPSNIIVEPGPLVKILDFGLAKRTELVSAHAADRTVNDPSITGEFTMLGTVAYMSPEQAEGRPVDGRSDIFSFGAVYYEMLAGVPAFQGGSLASVLASVLRGQPEPIGRPDSAVPFELERIVHRCLEKRAEDRYASTAELLDDLHRYRRKAFSVVDSTNNELRKPRAWRQARVIVPAVLLLLVMVAVAAGVLQHSRAEWARREAVSEINRLIDEDRLKEAYVLAERAEAYLPNDPRLIRIWRAVSRRITLRTSPPEAAVYRRGYDQKDAAWVYVGTSPLVNFRIPVGLNQWRVEKAGYAPILGSLFPNPFVSPPGSVTLTLDRASVRPANMVRVSAGNVPTSLDLPGLESVPPVSLGDYWIDETEVTNQQFKAFLEVGGYRREEFWDQPFIKDGRELSWPQAQAFFLDSTGQPGPSNWSQGEYPAGQGQFPVSGISWYEAAAYAKWMQKRLPSIWEWSHAAGVMSSNSVVPASNFGGQGPASVQVRRGLGPWGTYDMAGNVKEWCRNEAARGKHYILGGSWDEPPYMFTDPDARSPFDRLATFGFRCVRPVSDSSDPREEAPVTTKVRDFLSEQPVSDRVFDAYRGLYAYDKRALNEDVQQLGSIDEAWTTEKVSLDAAYGNERLFCYLFLPKRAKRPLQTVVFFPGSYALTARTSEFLPDVRAFDFVLKSGRAVLYPVYKGTYERGGALRSDTPDASALYRDHVITWSKDLGRSIDYLETRSDINAQKLAYYGLSWGAAEGALLPVIETRLKACILYLAGLYLQAMRPEVDPFNFAPRLTKPVLMLNGRYDFFFPADTSQIPLYNLIGTASSDKRRIIYEGGHNIPRNELIKETLHWLDRYLGPVNE